jgi:hypothetical protein
MFQLLALNQSVENEYVDLLLSKLIANIKDSKLPDTVKEILLPDWKQSNPKKTDKLRKLLINKPVELKRLNDELQNQINAKCSNSLKNKDIEKAFGYEKFISQCKLNSYWLAKKIGHNTCVYCNRQYIFTIEKTGGKNDKNRIVRPVFDHWFPKAKYPLMSLSLYNLIPSCSICNSSVKGGTEFPLGEYIHPYVPESINFMFVPEPVRGHIRNWTVNIYRAAGSKEDNTIKAFRLDEIYAVHGDFEVKDIMDLYDSYTSGYLQDMVTLLQNGNVSYTKEQLYRMIFSAEMNPDQFLDRPFSKLKHDLLKFIGFIE